MEGRRAEWMSMAGTLLSVIALVSMLVTLFRGSFPTFSPAGFSTRFIELSGSIGQGISSLLWEQRNLDLIAQAFLVIASAACCIAMLKPEKGVEEGK